MAHGDAVGHGDGDELARRAAGGADAALGDLGMALERGVAGRGFIPARHHADERLGDVLLGQAHGVVEGAVRRTLRPRLHVAAAEIVVRLLAHGDLPLKSPYSWRPGGQYSVILNAPAVRRIPASRRAETGRR